METISKKNLLFTVFVLFFQVGYVTSTCTYTGRTFQVGDTWVDAEACDACRCDQYGVQCYARLDDGHCKLNRSIVNPGDPICRYVMTLHTVGETFMAVDGCNTCTCTLSGMNCTINSCNLNGFAQPSKVPLYGECMYDNQWYPLHSQWLSREGCNTCFCYTVGNYRGGHVCTENSCHSSLGNVAG